LQSDSHAIYPSAQSVKLAIDKIRILVENLYILRVVDIETQKFARKLAVVAASTLKISLILIKTKGGKSKRKTLSAVCKVAEPVLAVVSKPISYHIEFVVEVQVNTVAAVQIMLIFIVVGE
jgi:hypothetical protein